MVVRPDDETNESSGPSPSQSATEPQQRSTQLTQRARPELGLELGLERRVTETERDRALRLVAGGHLPSLPQTSPVSTPLPGRASESSSDSARRPSAQTRRRRGQGLAEALRPVARLPAVVIRQEGLEAVRLTRKGGSVVQHVVVEQGGQTRRRDGLQTVAFGQAEAQTLRVLVLDQDVVT